MAGRREQGRRLPVISTEVLALAAKVFGNHLLRDIIVNSAIHNTDGLLDPSTVCFLRAVGKDWNDSVCKLLHKSGEPLFKIFVSNRIVLNGVGRTEGIAEFFNGFTETFGMSPSHALGRGPTYYLILIEEAFVQDNYNILFNFFRGCGQGIVYLSAHVPLNGGSLNGTFPNLSLPSLQRASFAFDQTRLDGEIGDADNVTNFIQSIFNGASNMKELTVTHLAPNLYQSSVFQNVVLPTSLNRIYIDRGFNSEDLEILLVKNHHPNLASLTLKSFGMAMNVGLLSRIFENVRGSLKYVCLEDNPQLPVSGNTVQFRFPRMENLETFGTTSKCCELEPGTRSLETCLPKLRVIKMEGQSAEMLKRWTFGSRLSSVQELRLKSSENVNQRFDSDIMRKLHLAFPTITKLTLEFNQMSVSGLQCMFMEMSNLVELDITKWGSVEEQLPDWDSVLIGIPANCTAGLKAAKPLWEKLQLNNDEDPSVRKLTELRTFSLFDFTDAPRQKSFLTDMTFQFAFLKMPELQKLNLSLCGKSSVSKEMQEKWRAEGRVLDYRRLQYF